MNYFINDVKKHEQCKKYALYMYEKDEKQLPYGTKVLDVDYQKQTAGFDAKTFQNGNDIIISFKGSFKDGPINSSDDFVNDFDIFRGQQPNQIEDAKKYLKRVQELYPDYNIILVGYSLGGTEAAILGAKYGIDTVTFNPLGVKNLEGVEINHPECVVNYCNPDDKYLTMSNAKNHIGTCYYVGTKENYNDLQHKLQAFKPLDTRVEFDQTKVHSGYNTAAENAHELEIRANRFLHGGFKDFFKHKIEDFKREIIDKYKNMKAFDGYSDDEIWNRYVNFEENKFFNPRNRVFYENEFNPVLAPKGSNNDLGIQEMLKQYYENDMHLPLKSDLDARVRTGELVYVHDYTRADGTKVSGYYRAYPNGQG